MDTASKHDTLFKLLTEKGLMRNQVLENTTETFEMFRDTVKAIVAEYDQFNKQKPIDQRIHIDYKDRGMYEFEFTFSEDILVFMMHSNVFEFSRLHDVMKTGYIREDNNRSFCGVIHIYNFLADSFRYNRENDLGYLIGRIFVNKDMHYFIEGKKELGFLYNNFNTAVMNEEAATEIVQSAMTYTINFDLLSPPYDEVKQLTVLDVQTNVDRMNVRVGKRLGFRFQADEV